MHDCISTQQLLYVVIFKLILINWDVPKTEQVADTVQSETHLPPGPVLTMPPSSSWVWWSLSSVFVSCIYAGTIRWNSPGQLNLKPKNSCIASAVGWEPVISFKIQISNLFDMSSKNMSGSEKWEKTRKIFIFYYSMNLSHL